MTPRRRLVAVFSPVLSSVLLLWVLASCATPRGAAQADEVLTETPGIETPGNETTGSELDPPFALHGELLAAVEAELRPRGDVARRAARVLEWIFDDVGLEYARHPTRDAVGTYAAREGNCLSFVNLFVGVGRHLGLAPFYVAVRDLERWDRRQGLVLSQGHVVAGLYVEGELRTFDFLPYRAKSYRRLEPIDDREAAAHVANNRGAEALLAGEIERARTLFERALEIDPGFAEAANNLGVWHLRHGEDERADEIFRRALDRASAGGAATLPLLTNLARLERRRGRLDEAEALLARADETRHRNPYFFVVRAESELERGEAGRALDALRDAFALEPDLPEVHLGLARAYLALGRLDPARHHLERALELDPHDPEARRLSAMLGAG